MSAAPLTTIAVRSCIILALAFASPAQAETKKKSIALEVHDSGRAQLVRSIPATNLTYGDVLANAGRLRPKDAIVIRCNGYGYGVMASDLFFPGGRQNETLMVAPSVPLKVVCEQMELSLKVR